MSNIFDIQKILLGKPEAVFCEFRDDNGSLTNPTNPRISIYNPNGSTVISSQTMLSQSTGIYYYIFTTTAGDIQGYYQAWFSGEVGGLLRTTDKPKPLYVRQLPWNWGRQYEFIRTVRRAIGDIDPSHYRIQDEELIYFIRDAVYEAQSKLPMGYVVDATPDGIVFNKELTTRAEVLFKWQTALLVLKYIINSQMYDVGVIETGDIVIDKSRHLGSKISHLKEQQKQINDFIQQVLSDDLNGIELITIGKGVISGWWD